MGAVWFGLHTQVERLDVTVGVLQVLISSGMEPGSFQRGNILVVAKKTGSAGDRPVELRLVLVAR
jgi:hypothetical protein